MAEVQFDSSMALAEDFGTGRCRLSVEVMKKLGLMPGDAITVRFPAKAAEAEKTEVELLCRAWPWPYQYRSTNAACADIRVGAIITTPSDTSTNTQQKKPSSSSPLLLRRWYCGPARVAVAAPGPFPPCSELRLRPIIGGNSSNSSIGSSSGNVSSASSSSMSSVPLPPPEQIRGVLNWALLRGGCTIYPPGVNTAYEIVECKPVLAKCANVAVMNAATKVIVLEDAAKTPKENEGSSSNSSLGGTNNNGDETRSEVCAVGGLDEELNELREAIAAPLLYGDLLGGESGSGSGQDFFARGVLLKGEPGVGKTLMVRSIARECGAKIYVINGPEVVGSRLGESEQALRRIFASALRDATSAQHQQPCVVFIDEIDSLCPARASGAGEGAASGTVHEGRIVTQVVALFDKIRASRHRVVVVAATNRPNAIDPALRRPGRFDLEIEVPVPGPAARADILRVCTRTMPVAPGTDLAGIALRCVGYVGADLAALCREAALAAMREGAPAVGAAHFARAMCAVVPSTRRATAVAGVGGVIWDDIGGLEDVKRELREAIEWPLLRAESLARMGVTPARGILMFGPPGCCKTTLVRAAANSCHASFLSVSGAAIYSPYLGDAEAFMRDLFKRARLAAPAIVFLDEIDSIVGSRTGPGSGARDDVRERVLSTLLNEMDGFERMAGVVVVAATNRVDLLDKALMRPGRFDRTIRVGLPDQDARAQIFRVHTRKMPLDPDTVSLDSLAAQTMLMSGADISCICREAAMCALREDVCRTYTHTHTHTHKHTAAQLHLHLHSIQLVFKYLTVIDKKQKGLRQAL